jgi:hypothetical protein
MKTTLLSVLALFTVFNSAQAAIVISEIDLVNNKVELVNTGSAAVDITAYWICNRLNGSPFYTAVGPGLIDVPNSSQNSLNILNGGILTLTLTAAIVPDASGEIGLYSTNSFGSSASLVDYVGWGADGVRDSVAEGGGIWVSGSFVPVSGISAGQTIQLGQGLAGNVAADYQLAASTIGVNQVPEPGTALLAGLGALTLLRRRRA